MQSLGPVLATLEEIEIATLYPQLSLLSRPIRHENGAFRERSLTDRNLKTSVSRFCVDGKHFEN